MAWPWLMRCLCVRLAGYRSCRIFFHGRLLYSLLSSYISDLPDKYNDLKILETGTARGFSAICMAKALIDNKYPGFITTIDAIPHNQSIYWNCIDDLDGPRSRAVLLKKWSAFGWHTIKANGHSFKSLDSAFAKIDKKKNKKPSVIIASTIKGKGISFMENQGKWHHKIPNEYELNKIYKMLA